MQSEHPSGSHIRIASQPDDSTCGPTCLHAVYGHYGDRIQLSTVIAETGRLEDGGSLGVFLACHALKRGYRARIYSYNLQMFDPTWFGNKPVDLAERISAQMQAKQSSKLQTASQAYLEFLQLGGEVRMRVLNIELIRKYLRRNIPILTGLSATFLYGEARELPVSQAESGITMRPDDIRGYPSGHFVVLCDYDPQRRTVLVADPLDPNPIARDHHYAVDIDRVFAAIMLGIVTYDANLLIIRPPKEK